MGIALVSQPDDARLPVYLTRFFGRDTELENLARLLKDPAERVITLVGPGGVGKTRLMLEGVQRVALAAVLYVDGVALARPDLLLPEIVDLLGIDRTAGRPMGEVFCPSIWPAPSSPSSSTTWSICWERPSTSRPWFARFPAFGC